MRESDAIVAIVDEIQFKCREPTEKTNLVLRWETLDLLNGRGFADPRSTFRVQALPGRSSGST